MMMMRFFIKLGGCVALVGWMWNSRLQRRVLTPFYWKIPYNNFSMSRPYLVVRKIKRFFSGFISNGQHYWFCGKGHRKCMN
jgi:hypothetical protein